MDYFRILSLYHYERRDKRFNSLAFKNSSRNGGISVISCECANRISGGVCIHIRENFPKHTNPPIYFKFSENVLPVGCQFDLDDSQGDICHYNLTGLSDKKAKDVFKDNREGNLFFCHEDEHVNKTELELSTMIDAGIIT